jgi:hypothetical protein
MGLVGHQTDMFVALRYLERATRAACTASMIATSWDSVHRRRTSMIELGMQESSHADRTTVTRIFPARISSHTPHLRAPANDHSADLLTRPTQPDFKDRANSQSPSPSASQLVLLSHTGGTRRDRISRVTG